MSAVPSDKDFGVEQFVQRRRARQLSKLGTLLIIVLAVLWSIQATVIADTDWDRIGGLQSIGKALGRFLDLDFGLIKHLPVPMLETHKNGREARLALASRTGQASVDFGSLMQAGRYPARIGLMNVLPGDSDHVLMGFLFQTSGGLAATTKTTCKNVHSGRNAIAPPLNAKSHANSSVDPLPRYP